MIASAPSFRNGFSRALGEWVCLRVRNSGSIRCPGEGEHGVVLTQVMHLTGRVARPYNICVGANSMFAPRSEPAVQEFT
jgi:hypothetical protein